MVSTSNRMPARSAWLTASGLVKCGSPSAAREFQESFRKMGRPTCFGSRSASLSKQPVACGQHGRSVGRHLSAGQWSDCTGAALLPRNLPRGRVMADKGYDSDKIRTMPRKQTIAPCTCPGGTGTREPRTARSSTQCAIGLRACWPRSGTEGRGNPAAVCCSGCPDLAVGGGGGDVVTATAPVAHRHGGTRAISIGYAPSTLRKKHLSCIWMVTDVTP